MRKGDEFMNEQEKSNVLDFPIKKMIRQKAFQKNKERKAVFGLSILSLFIFTLAVNQWVRDYSFSQNSNRGIASLKAEIKYDILNEQALAKRLADKENDVRFINSSQPSLKDELLFSFLEGKYKVQSESQRIKQIRPSEEMVLIKEGETILKKYISLFNENAINYKLKDKIINDSKREEVYELLDSKGLVVDTLSVSIDSHGKLSALEIL